MMLPTYMLFLAALLGACIGLLTASLIASAARAEVAAERHARDPQPRADDVDALPNVHPLRGRS